ncbi:MAG TPA: V-type ATP synthase subunit D [Atopostipes sp.]|nr:V-type ATP synthase subunit D [Atopostipes sp.]
MARLNVNPTKMELTRLRERHQLASRGHKLLKDKLDELMRQFIQLIRENNALRNEVEEKIESGMKSYSLASALLHDKFLGEVMTTPSNEVSLNIDQENIMNIRVPQMNFNYEDTPEDISEIHYGYLNSNGELDSAIEQMLGVMPRMLQLAETEKRCQLIADEIEKTRRRVNALEYKTIPDLEETIYFIEMKLEENERAEITRLIKVKDMG